MVNPEIYEQAAGLFKARHGRPHTAAAYAPGRVEVLGNHTDYNDGYVLSAAINFGTFFLAAPNPGPECRLIAGDVLEEIHFDIRDVKPSPTLRWANYVMGVVAGIKKEQELPRGFDGLFLGNIPIGSGLSSSAALTISTGLALTGLYGITLEKMKLARIAQAAEHEFTGAKCGLMDQFSSLYGRKNQLVMSDFRTFAVENIPLGDDVCFLMCNTNVKHSLVECEYNERREKCESAAQWFRQILQRPVKALRDVVWHEFEEHKHNMEPVTAKRVAHVIGENRRVLEGRELLSRGDVEGFGRLMFESHHSSRHHFENSSKELDFIVDTALKTPGVLGARLSGGGFGGSAVILVHPRDVAAIRQTLTGAYQKHLGHACDIQVITPSDGAAPVPA
jgi:galactokinase